MRTSLAASTPEAPLSSPKELLDGSVALDESNAKVVDAPTLETPDDSPANDEREDSSGCACAVSILPSCEEDGVNEETSEAGEREDVEDVQQEFAAASPTTTIIEKFAEKNGVPPLIVWNAFKEEITKAADKIEKSTGIFSSIEEAMDTVFDKIGDETEDAIYTQVNKFNGSAFQVVNQVNQTVDEVIDMAASHAAHIIASPESLNPTINGDVEYDQESEGEGMEISLAYNIGDTRTLAEI